MHKEEYDKLYKTLYEAYDQAALKDEYIRSSIGDILDHMIYNKQKLILST